MVPREIFSLGRRSRRRNSLFMPSVGLPLFCSPHDLLRFRLASPPATYFCYRRMSVRPQNAAWPPSLTTVSLPHTFSRYIYQVLLTITSQESRPQIFWRCDVFFASPPFLFFSLRPWWRTAFLTRSTETLPVLAIVRLPLFLW